MIDGITDLVEACKNFKEGGVFIDFIFSRVSQAIVIHARDKTFGLFSDIKADSWLLPMGLQPTVGVCEE